MTCGGVCIIGNFILTFIITVYDYNSTVKTNIFSDEMDSVDVKEDTAEINE